MAIPRLAEGAELLSSRPSQSFFVPHRRPEGLERNTQALGPLELRQWPGRE